MAEKPKKSPKQKRTEKAAQRKEWTQEEINAAMKAAGGTPKDEVPETPRGPGRPRAIVPGDWDRVEAFAAGGLTKAEIAESLGTTYETLRKTQNEFPAFLAAIRRGKSRNVRRVENSMHRSANGYAVPEEKVFFDGQTGTLIKETVIKQYPPDVRAQHLILQHAETGSWKPKQEITLIDPIADKLKKARERAKRG